jgi:hypothetical protein
MRNPEKIAAASLYSIMGDSAEGVLEDLWPRCRPDWLEFLQNCTSEELEAWQEPIFRKVMLELGNLCIWRARQGVPCDLSH